MFTSTQIILFFVINIFFGSLFYKIPILSNLFAILVVFLGSVYSIFSKKNIAIYCLLFIATYGIVLKVLRSGTFYEFDKYAVLGLSVLIVLFSANNIYKSSRKYGFFFLSLIPGMILAQFDYDNLSLYMSGPLALAFSAIMFSDTNIKLDLSKCLLSFLSPMIMLSSVLIIHMILNAGNIKFGYTAVQDKITTGGFGPNQVSTVLGFGMVLSIILFFHFKDYLSKAIFLAFWFVLLIQASLSFGRGGLYGGIIGSAIIFFYNSDKIKIISLSLITFICYSIFLFIISNNSFFDNDQIEALTSRVTQLTTTGRIQIMIDDLKVFLDNPLTGVGVGQSTEYHVKDIFGGLVGSHTFFTRLLAEHGILGLICLFIMMETAVNSLLVYGSNFRKSIIYSFMFYSLFSMMHNDLRLGITVVIFSFCEYLYRNKI